MLTSSLQQLLNEAEVLAWLDTLTSSHQKSVTIESSLSSYRHRNLVPIVAVCPGPKVPAILYEYMEEGSLYDHIHVVSKCQFYGSETRLRVYILHSPAS